MTDFKLYLEEAKKAVEQKYDVKVSLLLGEYTPDIENFLFHYYFVSAEPAVVVPDAYKVTVNTWDDGQQHRLLIRKCQRPTNTCLEAVVQPVNVSLMEGYDTAVAHGYKPNLYGAVVFLENSSRLQLGPGYWFMNELNDSQWIFVSILTKKVLLTEQAPCTL